jgi:hypothetical protein
MASGDITVCVFYRWGQHSGAHELSLHALVLMPLCQTVFTFRVQTVTHNVWLALPAYINQLSRVAIGITAGILSYSVNDVVVFHDKYLFLVYMNLVPSVVVS